MSLYVSMISFEGRKNILNRSDILARRAHEIYPHISQSKVQNLIGTNYKREQACQNLRMNLCSKLNDIRYRMSSAKSELPIVIEALKDKKVGNCYEEARLAEIIGRINGQNDIFSGRIFFGTTDTKEKTLDHVVAFVTSKKVEPKSMLALKNKEGIIIDPWLGISDFAGEYFNKIKTIFQPFFTKLPSHTSEIKFRIEANFDEFIEQGTIDNLKQRFPELEIKNYKNIVLE